MKSVRQSHAASYEEIPYPSHAYEQTFPDNLALAGILSGLEPADVAACRVLELGCASGGNLIPMAYALPGASFVGVDFSGRAIAAGMEVVEALGLTNITLLRSDIQEVAQGLGLFDYVIVHGIYSWVGPEVREGILRICRENMAPNGIAYVSYNVLPGWHVYGALRDLMLFHARNSRDMAEAVREARHLLAQMEEVVPMENNPYGQIVRQVRAIVEQQQDGYVRHDFMAEVNEPVYFHEFVERLESHGLQYMANADMGLPPNLTRQATELAMTLSSDVVEGEQYLDFMSNRTFRQTLLCHREQIVQRQLEKSAVRGLRAATPLKPLQENVDILSTEAERFEDPNEKAISTGHPLTKAALLNLGAWWPSSLDFKTLQRESWSRIREASSVKGLAIEKEAPEHELETLAENMLRLFVEDINLLRFRTHQPAIALEPGELPVASAVARYQAQREQEVVNLHHQRVKLQNAPRQLIRHLDGKHDRRALVEAMTEAVVKGLVEVTRDEQPVTSREELGPLLTEIIEPLLKQLAQSALLEE